MLEGSTTLARNHLRVVKELGSSHIHQSGLLLQEVASVLFSLCNLAAQAHCLVRLTALLRQLAARTAPKEHIRSTVLDGEDETAADGASRAQNSPGAWDDWRRMLCQSNTTLRYKVETSGVTRRDSLPPQLV